MKGTKKFVLPEPQPWSKKSHC